MELNYFGMNHGLGMTVFLLPEEKVAYIADIVTPNRVLFASFPISISKSGCAHWTR